MFEVVTCGFEPARLSAHSWSRWINTVPWPQAPDFLEVGYDALKARIDHPVVLLHDGSAEARRRVATQRSVLRSPNLLTLGLDAPLTTLSAAAAWLSSLAAASVPAGLAVSYLDDRYRQVLPTYAVVSSVAGLDLAQVNLGHHLLSLVPGTTFSVELDRRARVTTGSLDLDLPRADATDLVTCSTAARYAAKLHGATPSQVGQRVEIASPGEPALWWGKAKFYEHTLVPRQVTEDVQHIKTQAASRCPLCGEQTFGPCPYCKMRGGVAA